MQEIIACDVDGNSIINLVQWDSDVYIYLSDTGIDRAYQVHFFNNVMDEALVVNSTFSNEKLKVKIPNKLLIEPYIITGYVNVAKDNESKCLYGFKINIRKKPKPSNLVHIESNDYVSIEKIRDECKEWAKNSESWAVGGTGTRTGEDTNNSKYFSQQSKSSANTASTKASEAATSASAAKVSETNAKTSETNSKASETAAKTSETNAANSKTAAANSATSAANSASTASTKATEASNSASTASTKATEAANSASAAKTSETNAKNSETNAKTSETNAASSKTAAKTSETNAASSASTASSKATEATNSATESKSYATGGTGTRTNENIDNAKYYYEQSKSLVESFSGALRPMGTVAFSNLPALSEASEGDMYNISNQFTTTDNFKEGSGNVIPAGANVYKTADGKWDVLAGTPVTGIKGNAESSYRRGNVNITPENIGALTNISIGTVTTGAAGSNASASASTNGTVTTLNLTIPKGDTGAKGDKGDKGDTGATGTAGAKGATGATGTRGSRWTTGTAITGTSTTATVFSGSGITDALVNDMYLNTSTGYVYKCTVAGAAAAAKWMYVGSIKGATGAQGAKGDKGDTGATGAAGAKGATGATGTRGSRWTTGTAITGTSTTATVFSGSGITDALVNDMYLNTSTGYVYKCTVAGAAAAAKWMYVGSIKGATGAQGAKGDKGDTGATGAAGAKGATGATGTRGSRLSMGTAITGTSTTATVFSGSGITDALVNDMYLNTSTWYVYRCTTAGAAAAAKWVYVGSIKGATGATGATGAKGDKGDKGDTGAAGAKGATGAQGAKGDKGDTGLVYGTCSTAAATAAKTVSLTGFTLATGAAVIVKFTVTNTAASPTLNVNSTGAKAIMYKNAAITAGYLVANKTYLFAYDGTYWQLVGDVDTNTTYSTATTTTAGLMSASDKTKLDFLQKISITVGTFTKSGGGFSTASIASLDDLSTSAVSPTATTYTYNATIACPTGGRMAIIECVVETTTTTSISNVASNGMNWISMIKSSSTQTQSIGIGPVSVTCQMTSVGEIKLSASIASNVPVLKYRVIWIST